MKKEDSGINRFKKDEEPINIKICWASLKIDMCVQY